MRAASRLQRTRRLVRLFCGLALIAALGRSGDAAADAADCAALDRTFDADHLVESTRYEGENGLERCVALVRLFPGGHLAVALPERWNERLMALGCAGFCGRLDLDAAAAWAMRGYAALTYDGGHGAADETDADWAHHAPSAEAAWAGGAIVAAVDAAKTMIARYYAEDLRFTYARGCGDAARQAMALAARAPGAVDGLALYAPIADPGGHYGPVAAARRRAVFRPDGSPRLSAADADALAQAAKASCDAADGAADGLIADLSVCRFAPAEAVCGESSRGDLPCLAPDAAAAAAALYADPTDGFGERLAIGRLAPGSEPFWAEAGLAGAAAQNAPRWTRMHDGYVRRLSTEFEIGDGWTPADYDFDRDPLDGEAARRRDRIAPDDLAPFFDRGGRAIVVHGLADPDRSPAATAAFAAALHETAADGAWIGFAPGIGGCGLDADWIEATDLSLALEAWVEVGETPADLSVTPRRTGGTGGPALVCRWPAVFRGGEGCVVP